MLLYLNPPSHANRELLGQALESNGGPSNLFVYCSPFSRTMLTARLAAGKAGLSEFAPPRFQVRDMLCVRAMAWRDGSPLIP